MHHRSDPLPHPDDPGWGPDVLGPEYARLTLPLEGEPESGADLVATLVAHRPHDPAPDTGMDVLYVHGWSDYFFQTELAEFWTGLGARFFALDLRRYGRSLRPGQAPGFIDDLSAYDEEIEAALAAMGHAAPDGERTLLLMGHSTGGLTLSLWVARNPGRAAGLVLNSPWLEFQAGHKGRAILSPVIEADAHVRPRASLPNVDLGFYARAVSRRFDGEWDYDLEWRPERSFPTTSAWLAAILKGHATVAEGLGIEIPILVLLSTRSTLAPRWSHDMVRTDTVLDVAEVARRSLDLGSFTTIARIEGALHDVVLSAPDARATVYRDMRRWVTGFFPAPSPPKRSWWQRLTGTGTAR